MFQPLSSLFNKPRPVQAQVSDIRYAVQRFLRQEAGSEAVYCETVRGGLVVVRVGSVLLKQEVLLAAHALAENLRREGDFRLEQLDVRLT